jgi:hypothetical protein
LQTSAKNQILGSTQREVSFYFSYFLYSSTNREYLQNLFNCLVCHQSYGEDKWFDLRYFYRDDTFVCHCTCGLAREAAARVLRKAAPGKFLSDDWVESLATYADNPSVIGFIVQQACLTAISEHGFHHGNVEWSSVTATIFETDLIQQLPRTTTSAFLVPADPNFKYIDALFIKVDEKSKTVFLAPIQVTINERHSNSEILFYEHFWRRIEALFDGYILSSTFIWIVERGRSLDVIDEQRRELRSGPKVIIPVHDRLVIKIEDVHQKLGEHLARARNPANR